MTVNRPEHMYTVVGTQPLQHMRPFGIGQRSNRTLQAEEDTTKQLAPLQNGATDGVRTTNSYGYHACQDEGNRRNEEG